MMKLIREELKPFGFRVLHETAMMTVLEDRTGSRRLVMTARGNWSIYRLTGMLWRKIESGESQSALLAHLRKGKNETTKA